jgi:hypothetical protein
MFGIGISLGGLILLLIRIAMYIVGGYCLFLLIKLIRRAIEALDIYIANNDRLNNKFSEKR